MPGIASAAQRTTASPRGDFQRRGNRRCYFAEVVAPGSHQRLRVAGHHHLSRAPNDVVAEPLQIHDAERVECLCNRHERLEIDGGHRDRSGRLLRRQCSDPPRSATDSFARISPSGSTAELPPRRLFGGGVSDDLLPAPEAARIRPVDERRPSLASSGWIPRIRSSTPRSSYATSMNCIAYMSHASITRRRGPSAGKADFSVALQLVQLDGVVGGAVVANGEQPRGIERRPADDGIGIHDAESCHHQHITAGRARIERPEEELLERFRVAAVDRAQELGLRVLAMAKRDALGTRLEVEINGRRHRRRCRPHFEFRRAPQQTGLARLFD